MTCEKNDDIYNADLTALKMSCIQLCLRKQIKPFLERQYENNGQNCLLIESYKKLVSDISRHTCQKKSNCISQKYQVTINNSMVVWYLPVTFLMKNYQKYKEDELTKLFKNAFIGLCSNLLHGSDKLDITSEYDIKGMVLIVVFDQQTLNSFNFYHCKRILKVLTQFICSLNKTLVQHMILVGFEALLDFRWVLLEGVYNNSVESLTVKIIEFTADSFFSQFTMNPSSSLDISFNFNFSWFFTKYKHDLDPCLTDLLLDYYDNEVKTILSGPLAELR